MVATIIALVVFFVLIDSQDDHLHNMAISVASLTELSLYSLTTIAVLIGIFQVSSKKSYQKALNELIILSQFEQTSDTLFY